VTALLQPVVADWALPGSAVRAARRNASSAAEREAFYAAILPLLPDALDRLDAKPLAQHDPGEAALTNLCLMAAHIALAVEALGPDEARHAPHRAEMRITRSPAGV
jgi:hypothetical protein